MDEVFSTAHLPRAQRYDAWRGAICDHYVHVDVAATKPDDYKGFIREARFGEVTLTDILISEQVIKRNNRHISQLDKDCYYLQFLHSGNVTVLQRGNALVSNPARGALFYATEQYELHCAGQVRSFYLELPRDEFARRFTGDAIPVSRAFDATAGLGRIATEFVTMLATESGKLAEPTRAPLGDQLMDMLALTLQSADPEATGGDHSVRQARLRLVKLWIDEHIGDPELTLDRVAHENGISLRYLHQLFRQEEKSVSEWIWDRRLQLCYEAILKGEGRLLTAIAFDHGFNSSAHFSTLFRKKFGMSPRDLMRR
ncbi:MAG: helix-turn-helix domain-containing protein [Pseudooceanicola sp.]|nr:helix-turn-helix domain-containing protein [Pseudooceanicola sp.]